MYWEQNLNNFQIFLNKSVLFSFNARHGGWILDNFPNTRDQWNLCIERNFLPDDVIVLRDSADGSKFLMKRYYHMNKDLIDEKIRKRIEEEELRKKQEEEERK